MTIVQKNVTVIRKSLPEYLSKLSADIESGFLEFFRRPLESTHEKVQVSPRGSKGSVIGALSSFEQIFLTLESQLDKKLSNEYSEAYCQCLALCLSLFFGNELINVL